ncbi:murein transglycosylase A [Azospirillum picis]|uniref:peptidoglycan lytic exotransglycosylase n=1 Tax=Azospirillum picis TaxID=488438 RepID=A0ABU0MJJ6_9PROT|nr:murein transglycosylase A [Azospirillum picis]MBP2299410.1 membrane-bound lytic murein transglycosylase A [Azospirillum picis]MDQ0533463.1 membrane-bound lytic murein transglycosylase A [Azospirillum picis]
MAHAKERATRYGRMALAAGMVATLAACAGGTPPLEGQRPLAQRPTLDQVAPDFRHLAGWVDDDHSQAVPAVQRTCGWVRNQPPGKSLGSLRAAGTTDDWRAICSAARTLPPGDSEAARRFFEAFFTPRDLAGGQDGLFTGYYEIELHGSWTRSDRYTVPLYRMPARGKKGLPTRARIDGGALKGKGLELMWVDDPIDAFFLEIQGSGRAVMADGSVVGIHYAGQNGHSYYPIGRHIIDRGDATPEQMSLQLIRQWLKNHPAEAQRVMNLNPSYVFFRLSDQVGARGARNMELTPGRSLAVDADHIPLGAPLWLEVRDAPVPGGAINRLVVAQDTGGAIKGPVRGDLFWGHGQQAADGAGVMKARGHYTLLAPRNLSVETAQRK